MLGARYKAREVAETLGIAVETFRLRCKRGIYQHHRSGREYYFTDDDLAAIEEAEKVPARKPDAASGGLTAGSQAYHDDVAAGQRRYTGKGRATRIR